MGVELLYNSVKTEVRQLDLDGVIDEMWQGKPHLAEGALGAPDELGSREVGDKMQ